MLHKTYKTKIYYETFHFTNLPCTEEAINMSSAHTTALSILISLLVTTCSAGYCPDHTDCESCTQDSQFWISCRWCPLTNACHYFADRMYPEEFIVDFFGVINNNRSDFSFL